jgi:hypothetical protein
VVEDIRAYVAIRDFAQERIAGAREALQPPMRAVLVRPPSVSSASARAVAANKTRREASRPTGADVLIEGSSAYWAAEAIRKAGKPLHATQLVGAIEEEQGHKVKLTTLMGTLYRWVKRDTHFYLAGPNTFGLVEMRNE